MPASDPDGRPDLGREGCVSEEAGILEGVDVTGDDNDLVAVAADKSMVRKAVVGPEIVNTIALELVQQSSGLSAAAS